MSILVATDFSENAAAALRAGGTLARASQRELRVMHVVDFTGDSNAWRILVEAPDDLEVEARTQAARELTELIDRVLPPGDTARPEDIGVLVRFGEPSDAIIEVVEEGEIDLVVVGTRGESRLQDIFFGRTPNELVRRCTAPILAVPPEASLEPVERILVPIDLSEVSQEALRQAAAIAEATGAAIIAMHSVAIPTDVAFVGAGAPFVVTGEDGADRLIKERQAELEEVVEAAGMADKVAATRIEVLRPHTAIDEVARELDVQLIVMGSHGRRGFSRFFLGSTAERVLRKPPCSVLVVKGE